MSEFVLYLFITCCFYTVYLSKIQFKLIFSSQLGPVLFMEGTINTLLDHERQTSTYADIYFSDDYCKSEINFNESHEILQHESIDDLHAEWISPSDLLIGKVELNPPFTSKITRGKTNEGILAIGNEVLEKEHKRFLASLFGMLHENDESWKHILINEKKLIAKRVKEIFHKIFLNKSKTMNDEIMKYYESTLDELEAHLQSEVQNILSSVHASTISALNIEIPAALKREKIVLEKVLKQKYLTEVNKVVTYYKLLLDNEMFKNNVIINCALNDRNNALKAFCRQIDAERLTTCMYVMSIERKKCRIRKMFLENYQNMELLEKLTKIKEQQYIIEMFKEKEQKIADINKMWEDKMKKILELFLKFISFSLKLLPEQSTFLIDFQKMVVLQLNEMQKQPNYQPNILIDEDNLVNIFQFESSDAQKTRCDNEPFVLVGDLSETPPPRYGSTETLPLDVDLPLIRVNRQYVYAKCHGYEEIKRFLKSQECQCAQPPPSPPLSQTIQPLENKVSQPSTSSQSSSSAEPLLLDNIHRLEKCPARNCGYWVDKYSFPFMPSYLDYSEQNYKRVKAIIGETSPKEKTLELLRVKNIAFSEVPFAETKEKYRHAQTQYSAQELDIAGINCTCFDEYTRKPEEVKSFVDIKESRSKILADALNKRKISLRRLLDQNPNLLKVFTDEDYDFQL